MFKSSYERKISDDWENEFATICYNKAIITIILFIGFRKYQEGLLYTIKVQKNKEEP